MVIEVSDSPGSLGMITTLVGDLGKLLRTLKLSGPGAELGVKQGYYTRDILKGWRYFR